MTTFPTEARSNKENGADRGVRLTVASIFIVVPMTVFWGQSGRSLRETAIKRSAQVGAVNSDSDSTASDPNAESSTQADDAQASVDSKYRELLVGKWVRQYHGKRVLSVKSDGTATMVIEPSTFYTLFFGKRLTIQLAWKIENGHAIYDVTGGSPADKLKIAKNTWGDRWDERILELNSERLVLKAESGSKSKWTRVETETALGNE